MKILLTNHFLSGYRGTELWTYFMAKELSKDHEVYAYTKQLGKVSDRMKEFCTVTDDADDIPETDLCLMNHYTTCEGVVKSKFIIHTRHGVIPQLELPTAGCNAYVSISEECKNESKEKGYMGYTFDSDIILNGVDTERFTIQKPLSKKLKTVLFLSNHHEVEKVVEKACEKIGAKMIRVGSKDGLEGETWNTEDYINQADLVVSLGRGSYESLSCGRPVIVFDKHGFDGIITKDSIDELIKNNCSGRRYGKKITNDDLVEEFKKYDPKSAEENRKLAIEYFNIKDKAKQYIDIWKKKC